MAMAAIAVTILVAVAHLYFLLLEMFLWQKPRGLKTFGQSAEQAAQTAVLAKNQGLYNGFLAVGLLWTLTTGDTKTRLYFLGCVAVAGAYGAMTVNRRILFVQAVPALIAIALTLLG